MAHTLEIAVSRATASLVTFDTGNFSVPGSRGGEGAPHVSAEALSDMSESS